MELVNLTTAAKELGLHVNTVRTYCQQQRLGEKIGNSWVISRDELEAFKQLVRTPGRPRKNDDTPVTVSHILNDEVAPYQVAKTEPPRFFVKMRLELSLTLEQYEHIKTKTADPAQYLLRLIQDDMLNS